MKFKIKRLTALVSLALVASSASAGNLCYLGLPGMGCSNAASGKADSTGNTWVGAQPAPSSAPWMPQTQDGLTQALIAAQNGTLPYANTLGFANRYWTNWSPSYQPVIIAQPAGMSNNACNNGTAAIYLLYNGSQYALGGDPSWRCEITCFPAGARVMMADGSERLIESIAPGAWLMGADGQPVQVWQIDRPVLGDRRMMAMADGSLLWSEEHGMWTRDAAGAEWWWSANPDAWRAEASEGVIGGLKDNQSMRKGDGYAFAHMAGWRDQAVVEAEGYGPDTPLYLPMTHGVPIIVNGYVVSAGINEDGYDYTAFRWSPEAVANSLAQQALARVMARQGTFAARMPEGMAA